MLHWTHIFFALWFAAFLVALWALRIAHMYAKHMPRNVARPLGATFPRVAVILPLKGLDPTTRQNVTALLDQDYPAFRLIFAVESDSDPAIPLLQQMAADAPPGRLEVVIAGFAATRGQKIHNQLAAVDRTSPADDILAFVDADAHPAPTWLHSLVAPLTWGPHIGATTGYRYYVPAPSPPATPTLPSRLVSVINAGVGALFGPYRRTFAWGGSMALRRADFFAYGIHDAWQTALSDDYVVSYCVKRRAHAKIHFVPQCLVPSPAAFTWPSFFEFAIRQYRITRVCAPWLWLAALTGPFLFLFALTSSFTLALAGLFLPFPHRAGLLAGLTFWTLYTMYLLRGFLLLRAAQRLLPAHWPAIRTTTLLFTFAYPLVQFINLLALLASALGRTITWRHVTYTMFSRTRTLVHRPPAPQALSEKARACVSE